MCILILAPTLLAIIRIMVEVFVNSKSKTELLLSIISKKQIFFLTKLESKNEFYSTYVKRGTLTFFQLFLKR